LDSHRAELKRLLEHELAPVKAIEGGRLAIYGAGGCGRTVAAQAQRHGLQVVAFIDARAPELGRIDDVPCFVPDSDDLQALAAKGLPVVIGVFNYATDIRPIRERLIAIGFSRVLSYQQFHELYGEGPNFWLTKRRLYVERAQEILDGIDLFHDELSKRIYVECMQFRLDLEGNYLNSPDIENHYLPQDLPRPRSPIRLVDAGAFKGDTIQLFLDRQIEIEAVAAFEPDPVNYDALCSAAEGYRDRMSELILLPCGVGARTELVRFSAGAGASSAIGPGETIIQVISLDDVLPAFSPSFLKLDIEGAEEDALRGAVRLMRRDRPMLAVSVYHAPEHLWTIPALIHLLQPEYHLALRYHQWNGFDIVAYAWIG
jgi:FkbM family methyltransferase